MLRCTISRFSERKLAALTPDAVTAALTKLPGWKYTPAGSATGKSTLSKEFTFRDFHEAWGFMSAMVPHINAADHHPEWFNVYNRVHVTLTTHDVGNAVSFKDVSIAEFMEAEVRRLQQQLHNTAHSQK